MQHLITRYEHIIRNIEDIVKDADLQKILSLQ